jgi:site-specific DNA recombinase
LHDRYPCHQAGVRYRYYVSQPGLHGEARTATLGSVSRFPEIEQAITSALQKHITEQNSGASDRADPINSTMMSSPHSSDASRFRELN